MAQGISVLALGFNFIDEFIARFKPGALGVLTAPCCYTQPPCSGTSCFYEAPTREADAATPQSKGLAFHNRLWPFLGPTTF